MYPFTYASPLLALNRELREYFALPKTNFEESSRNRSARKRFSWNAE